MTFYSIIFGILFVGACRQFLVLLDSPHLWVAATIAVLVFNDTVNTSQVVETQLRRPYTIGMKLIDLASFLILSVALMSLAPDNNFFQVNLPVKIISLFDPSYAWGFVSLYWIIALWWNSLAGFSIADIYPVWYEKMLYSLAAVFVLMTVLSLSASDRANEHLYYLSLSVFLVVTVVLFVVKPIVIKKTQDGYPGCD